MFPKGKSSCVGLTSSQVGKLRLREVKPFTQHPQSSISNQEPANPSLPPTQGCPVAGG